ncbi:hypothetical protein [Streptomyces sp. NPDC058757]|uniref:hypothetical protein n=1 Tax=Streptomyces sp. NPDC058757 TaxID=3346626 RepID=UPI0036CB751D
MSRTRITSLNQPLPGAGAAVIIVIVIAAAALAALAAQTQPLHLPQLLGTLAFSAALGTITVRLAATGLTAPLRTSAVRLLAAPPQG